MGYIRLFEEYSSGFTEIDSIEFDNLTNNVLELNDGLIRQLKNVLGIDKAIIHDDNSINWRIQFKSYMEYMAECFCLEDEYFIISFMPLAGTMARSEYYKVDGFDGLRNGCNEWCSKIKGRLS